MRNLIVALSAVTLLAGTPALAAPCKDAKTGKFVKCPKAAAVAGIVFKKDKNGKCHGAGGKFVPCPK